MLGAASCGLPVLLDGFLSYAAALAACQMSPAIKPYLIPSHLSAEKGARIALSHLGLEPYLNMDMRLGEEWCSSGDVHHRSCLCDIQQHGRTCCQ